MSLFKITSGLNLKQSYPILLDKIDYVINSHLFMPNSR